SASRIHDKSHRSNPARSDKTADGQSQRLSHDGRSNLPCSQTHSLPLTPSIRPYRDPCATIAAPEIYLLEKTPHAPVQRSAISPSPAACPGEMLPSAWFG